ncbi:Pycsar system effector family protein [Kushneria konosiri]|uniref:Pycsar effector protein domain-containing protein n=1 Tax=Kushneria konosiri TaxID=698828 RepID=A0A2Z2H5K2_9GAMM|nr:Pycsar system effector family protein [Kushneria konosiri]ARS52548.1 hypothetical protein B9G99_06375 [Kushneria konosiri]
MKDGKELNIETLWETLKRYDGYINGTNFKSALLATLNAALFAGIIIKYISGDFLTAKSCFLDFIVSILSLSLTISYWYVIKTIWPNLGLSGNEAKKKSTENQCSLIFFGSVSKMSLELFKEKYQELNEESLEEDLISQVHDVATVASNKFRLLNMAGSWTFASVLITLIFIISANYF